MKKFIQFSSILSLLVLFSVAASAQTNFGTDINIPFAFNVGDHSYEAGNYIVKFDRKLPGAAMLSIEDPKTDKVQTLLLTSGGEVGSSEFKLVFDTVDGQRYLTKVRTAVRTYALIKTKSQKNLAKTGAGKAGEPGDAANMF